MVAPGNDSIGRCNHYDNPYNVRAQARPELTKRRQDNYLKSQDTLGVHQEKLEKQLFMLLKQKNFMGSGPFILITRAGKYLFLGLLLPPYIFMYGLPKWLLTALAPKLFKFVKGGAIGIVRTVKNAINAVLFPIKAAMKATTDPILNFIQARIEKGRELYHHTGSIARKFTGAMSFPYRWLNAKFFVPIRKTIRNVVGILPAFKKSLSRLKILKDRAHQHLVLAPGRIYQALQNAPVVFKPLIDLVNRQFARLQRPLLEAVTHASNTINYLMAPIRNFPGRVSAKLKKTTLEFYHKFADPITSWMSSRVDFVKRSLGKTREKLIDAPRKAAVKILSKVRKLWDAVVEKGAETLRTIGERAALVPHILLTVLPQPVVVFLTGFLVKAPERLFSAGTRLGKKYKESKQKLKRALAVTNQRFLSFMRRRARLLWPKIVAAPKKIKNGIKKGIFIAVEMLQASFYLLRLMWAWVKVLCKYGILLLRQSLAGSFPALR